MKRLLEFVLPSIIGVYHKFEKLTQKELNARESFMKKLTVIKRKTKSPVVVAMVGLVGSGKSSVAKEIAQNIGATILEGDEVRIELRKQGGDYAKTRKIVEDTMIEIIKQGGSVILDSDHIDQKKRASVRKKLQKTGAHLIFIRTYADFDIVFGRVITAKPDEFFSKAKTKWDGNSKGAVVKIREMHRRTPHHYRWTQEGGGKWLLKKLPFSFFVEINTGEPDWKKSLVQKINTL